MSPQPQAAGSSDDESEAGGTSRSGGGGESGGKDGAGGKNWLQEAAPSNGLRAGSQITLVLDGEPLAHGFLLDNETDVKRLFDHEDHLVPERARIPTHWKTVRITSVARGEAKTYISRDSVFACDGTQFEEKEEMTDTG